VAFDVLIVLMGLVLSHQMMKIYDRSVEVNQTWVERLDRIEKLAPLAGNVKTCLIRTMSRARL
jgi:acetate kinase